MMNSVHEREQLPLAPATYLVVYYDNEQSRNVTSRQEEVVEFMQLLMILKQNHLGLEAERAEWTMDGDHDHHHEPRYTYNRYTISPYNR
mmetsp:Transcript_8845/g.21531  ORF Transcript_8845/g.21531 Transcript_8845/m.21531 type:complete len:89 (-) Transcript_8845:2009-2275(-)